MDIHTHDDDPAHVTRHVTPHVTRLMLRLPPELADRLRRLASAHDRSLNGELVWALRAYVTTVEREEENERSGE